MPVTPARDVPEAVADLTDPALLARLAIRPDAVASFDRRRTRGIARRLYDEGWTGLHWWSAIAGDWHTTVMFLEPNRVSVTDLRLGIPEPLTLEHPAVSACLGALGIERP